MNSHKLSDSGSDELTIMSISLVGLTCMLLLLTFAQLRQADTEQRQVVNTAADTGSEDSLRFKHCDSL